MSATAKSAATTFSTPSDREVVLTRVVDAPRRLVFAAHTDPAHVPHWMLGPEGWTMPICEIDLRPGGGWRFVWRKSDGSEMGMHGVYQEVVPHERVVWTEAWGEGWPATVNTLILTEQAGKTIISQRVLYPSKEARDAALKSGMIDGASQSYDRLAAHLATLA